MRVGGGLGAPTASGARRQYPRSPVARSCAPRLPLTDSSAGDSNGIEWRAPLRDCVPAACCAARYPAQPARTQASRQQRRGRLPNWCARRGLSSRKLVGCRRSRRHRAARLNLRPRASPTKLTPPPHTQSPPRQPECAPPSTTSAAAARPEVPLCVLDGRAFTWGCGDAGRRQRGGGSQARRSPTALQSNCPPRRPPQARLTPPPAP